MLVVCISWSGDSSNLLTNESYLACFCTSDISGAVSGLAILETAHNREYGLVISIAQLHSSLL